MRRDDRKKQKKRLKERKKASARKRSLVERRRADLYPKIILDPMEGDPEFVSIVERVVAGFDFEDPAICSSTNQLIFQSLRREGFKSTTSRIETTVAAGVERGLPQAAMEERLNYPLFMLLGDWIFKRLPEPCRMQPLPFYYFFVAPVDHDLVIKFNFLPSVAGGHGRIYHSPLEPTVPFGGGNWKVGFSRHAIERICERICPTSEIGYSQFNLCAMYFRYHTYFEPLELPDGQQAIRLLDYCYHGDYAAAHPYVSDVLAQAGTVHEDSRLGYVLGYCPVSFIGPRAVAKTFLYPGYRNTPEDHLVRTASMSAAERQKLLALASDNNAHRVFRDGGLEAIKWYHHNGVPQVFPMKQELSHLRKRTEQ